MPITSTKMCGPAGRPAQKPTARAVPLQTETVSLISVYHSCTLEPTLF